MAKIALGTVQFGLNYGINNQTGQVSSDEVLSILQYASQQGITVLDTAYAYGVSEKVLGELHQDTNAFQIISKFPNQPNLKPQTCFQESLDRLQKKSLYGYMFHHFQTFKDNPLLWDDFVALKTQDKVQKIGFSVYYPHEITYLLDHKINFDIIQCPYSIFDRRFEPIFPILKEKNIEIHVRSVFLQGLVFKTSDQLTDFFQPIHQNLLQLHQIALNSQIAISDICLNFTFINPYIDNVVIGVDRLTNLVENIQSIKLFDHIKLIYPLLNDLQVTNEQMLLPFLWNIKG